jgi:hypothetical protein
MEQIIVALIGVVGTVLGAMMHRNRKAEKKEHAVVVMTLSDFRNDIKTDLADINQDIKVVEAKLDTHIRDHAIGNMDDFLVGVETAKVKRKKKQQ